MIVFIRVKVSWLICATGVVIIRLVKPVNLGTNCWRLRGLILDGSKSFIVFNDKSLLYNKFFTSFGVNLTNGLNSFVSDVI